MKKFANRCKRSNCGFNAWRRRLCYTHWRKSRGFVFDALRKVFVKAK
jgi:hypothetical protein